MQRKMIPKLSAEARVGPTTLDRNKRTVTVVASTGSRGPRNGYDESLDVTKANLARLNSGKAPVLNSHRSDGIENVIGVVERAWIEGSNLMSTVRFSNTPLGDQALAMIADGTLGSVSIGYRVNKYADMTQKSDTRAHYRAVDWEIFEVSMVAIPFDQNAAVRSDDESLNEVEIIKPANAEGSYMDPVKAEKERQREIRIMVRTAGLDQSFEDQLIDGDTTADEARKLVLAEMAKRTTQASAISGTTRINVDGSNEDKRRNLLVDSLVARFTGTEPPKDSAEFAGKSLLRNLERIIPRRLGMTDVMYARAAMSSSDLPYILANVAEKGIVNRMKAAPPTWSAWAGADTVRNYKTKDLLKSGDFPSLLERQEGAEFKNGVFGEEREQVAVKDWGILMAFTRRMLINDDLGEIQNLISQSSVAVNQLENSLVYSVLTGNPTMADGHEVFKAEHSNLLSAAALTDVTIGEAFRKMREQLSVDGLRKLNIAPKYLICGPSEEGAARKYLAQINPTQASNVNPYSGTLELIVDAVNLDERLLLRCR